MMGFWQIRQHSGTCFVAEFIVPPCTVQNTSGAVTSLNLCSWYDLHGLLLELRIGEIFFQLFVWMQLCLVSCNWKHKDVQTWPLTYWVSDIKIRVVVPRHGGKAASIDMERRNYITGTVHIWLFVYKSDENTRIKQTKTVKMKNKWEEQIRIFYHIPNNIADFNIDMVMPMPTSKFAFW